MRLWSIHPKYLDAKGLVALWRESLLAQKVLKDQTKGYKFHPQLNRFKNSANPIGAISTYLYFVYEESMRRNYQFNKEKIDKERIKFKINCNDGQILYEFNYLSEKLKKREINKFMEIKSITKPEPHPIFKIVKGDKEIWEKGRKADKL